MNDAVLAAIGRKHGSADVLRAFDEARQAGFDEINMDLIAGLTGDTAETFAQTVDTLLNLSPENITVHTLAIKRGADLTDKAAAAAQRETVSQMLDGASHALQNAGYGPYYLYRQKFMAGGFENVGWCKPGTECFYNVSMMEELQKIKQAVTVHQTLLVVDAMTGQDAVNVAKEFDEKVGIDGVILSKMDGDTRGGAALSIKAVTGKPIFYVGMGEKLSDLEQFYPERMASRILGMGDVMSLIEKVEASVDQEQAQEMQKKLKKMDFDFNDYLTSMEQMNKMGGISSILNMLPGMGGKMKDIEGMIDEKAMDRTKSIILSMTPQERSNPNILNISRKNRIARGAGVDITEVNRLVKQFEQSKKMMKQMPGLTGGKMNMGKRGGFKLPF
mgnify:CR=1 FL=1